LEKYSVAGILNLGPGVGEHPIKPWIFKKALETAAHQKWLSGNYAAGEFLKT